jgi:hypothetical protein
MSFTGNTTPPVADQKAKPTNPVVRIVPLQGTTGNKPGDYCRHGQHGQLTVRLENSGDLQAAGQKIRVNFRLPDGKVDPVTITSPVIPPHSFVDVAFPIPDAVTNTHSGFGFSIKWSNKPLIRGFCDG